VDTKETATIVRLVKSLFPQQPIDPTTYETWHLVIGRLDFTTAQAAVIAIAHSQKFCCAADIIAEADRARGRHEHPSARPVAELIGAPAMPPTAEYLAAKAEMDAKFAKRAEQAALTDHVTSRRAQDWINYKLSGRPVMAPLSAPAAPRWVPLPGDPPELRQWLARQPADAPP
jgi:hypothetical protein